MSRFPGQMCRVSKSLTKKVMYQKIKTVTIIVAIGYR